MHIPSVTIIIPCFNASSYIEKCLSELNNQHYRDFEVICVDDASSDNTVEVIDNYKHNASFNIRIIKNESNVGPAVSRNRGVCAANTKYITFCDSDDWYRYDYLSSMVESLEKNDADIVFCGYTVINEYGAETKRPLLSEKEILKSNEAIVLNVDSLCMMMVKTTLMKRMQIPDVRNGEDMAVIPLLIASSDRCVVISEPLYYYFRRTDSASQTLSMKVVNSFIKAFEYIEENIDNSCFQREIEYLGIRNLLYPTIISLLTFSNDYSKANEIVNYFENKYPTWSTNVYLDKLPKYKKIVLFLIKHKMYRSVRLVAQIRKKI